MTGVDSIHDYFANIGMSLASGSNCSILEETITPKSLDKTMFLYPTDANEVYNIIINCKTRYSSGLDGLSNSLLKYAGPVISDFLAVQFNRSVQLGNSQTL